MYSWLYRPPTNTLLPLTNLPRIRQYVGPSVVNVVRGNVNSLWSHGFLDLAPLIVSPLEMNGR